MKIFFVTRISGNKIIIFLGLSLNVFHTFNKISTMRITPANIRLDEDLLKTSWRRLSSSSSEDVFKTSWSRPIYSSWLYVFKTSWRRFEDVFKTSSRGLAKTSSRRFHDVFKTSCKNIFKTSSRRLQEVLKTSWKRLQDV